MEIWIAKGSKKELRKAFPYIRDFAVIDVKEIANSLGYETSIDLDEHSYYVLSSEIQKRLVSLNSSKRFFRILYLVEDQHSSMGYELLNFSVEHNLTYDKIYTLEKDSFELFISSDDYHYS